MYAGFELENLNEIFFSANFKDYLRIGNASFDSHKTEIVETLKTFINKNGSLNGDKMQSAWFPQIDADVFLSHSHADENLVIAFAGWLKDVFEINVFIDSCIWGYSMDLQKILDREYNKDNKYNKAIYASSHVHMMLNTALMQMIDNCECVIFVNTPNSVKPREVILGDEKDKLVSPWIYSEIGMTKLIRKKSIVEHRNKKLFESKEFSQLEIEYNLDTDHLIKLNESDLRTWRSNYRQMPSYQKFIEESERNALNILYELKERL